MKKLLSADEAARFWPVAVICSIAAACLGLVQFVGSDTAYAYWLPGMPDDQYAFLRYRTWWIAWTDIGFFAIPFLVMAVWRGGRLRDCHLSLRGFFRHFWIYAALYAVMFPLIYAVSWQGSFLQFYPMYLQAGRSWTDLLIWEGLYAGQFVAVEFFFRGFLVGGLGRHLGLAAIPVAVMPYMMLHFGKPWPEAYGALFAGFALGALVWKTKSIWGGVFIHCAIALTMDFLALSHKGQLPWLHR